MKVSIFLVAIQLLIFSDKCNGADNFEILSSIFSQFAEIRKDLNEAVSRIDFRQDNDFNELVSRLEALTAKVDLTIDTDLTATNDENNGMSTGNTPGLPLGVTSKLTSFRKVITDEKRYVREIALEQENRLKETDGKLRSEIERLGEKIKNSLKTENDETEAQVRQFQTTFRNELESCVKQHDNLDAQVKAANSDQGRLYQDVSQNMNKLRAEIREYVSKNDIRYTELANTISSLESRLEQQRYRDIFERRDPHPPRRRDRKRPFRRGENH